MLTDQGASRFEARLLTRDGAHDGRAQTMMTGLAGVLTGSHAARRS
jgi:hypothetical protein